MLLKNLVQCSCTKHMDIQFHFVKEHICCNNVEFQYCSTKEMTTYLFTKGVFRDQFETCKNKLGLIPFE
jgi:hypothetical protein